MVSYGLILSRNTAAFDETSSSRGPMEKERRPMKIVKTAAVGSLVALAGAGALAYFGPLIPQGVVEILLSPGRNPLPLAAFRDHVHQWDCSSAWSAVGAVAFAAGLIIAVGAIAHANRSRGVSVLCRPLLFLAAASALAAATTMFLATGYFFLTFRALIASDYTAAQLDDERFRPPPAQFDQFDGERFRQSLRLGPLYAGFALLVGVSVCLVAASFLKTTERPPRPPNRLLTVSNVGLTRFLGLSVCGNVRC